MKKLLLSTIIILLLSSVLLISCGEDVTTTTTDITTTTVTDITTTESLTYNISYELNGGTNSAENPSIYNKGDIITLSFPTREDYMFMGWYTDSSLTNEIKEINGKEENLTFYAKWIPFTDIFTFYEVNDGYRVTIHNNIVTDIIIPSSYKGVSVTDIYTPNGISESVKYIYVPETINRISGYGFTISEPDEASLEYIDVDLNNPYFKSVDGVMYSKDGKCLVQYPSGKKEDSFVIPHGTIEIGKYAFACCKYLKKVTIADTVTTIGAASFYECAALERIAIPNSVVILEFAAFYKCTSLKSVTLSKNIEIIRFSAFEYCSSLEEIIIHNGTKIIDTSAFSSCSSLKSVTIPNSVTTIRYRAFAECGSIENIIIPRSVTVIGNNAFESSFDELSITVYCEAESKPDGWKDFWDRDVKEVIWGYKAV